MNSIVEPTAQHYTLLAALAAAAVILCLVWLRTGKRWPLVLAGVAGVLIVALLAAEKLIVTDREVVEATLRQIAADVERNDVQAVVGHIHHDRTDLVARVEAEFPRYEFEEVDIKNNLEIEVDGQSAPPTAVARFNVVVRGKLHGGGDFGAVYGEEGVPRFVIVKFQMDDDAWKVIELEHYPPVGHGQ